LRIHDTRYLDGPAGGVMTVVRIEAFMETKKVNVPKRGAGRALAKKLEDLSNQKPPKDLVHKLSRGSREEKKIAASPRRPLADSKTSR
jgi:hypothetical protein